MYIILLIKRMVKHMVKLSMLVVVFLLKLLRMVIRMVVVSMQEVKKELLKMYFNINLVIVSKLKLHEVLLKVYFDINFDIVTRLMDILMVIVSMMKIQVILEMVKQMKLKYFYQDNNQDILSRLSETRASIQVFCPRFNYMGISCPRSIFVN